LFTRRRGRGPKLMNRCLGTKRDNSPCTVSVEPPQTFCWWHDPANADARKQAAARGGKRAGRGRPLAELSDIKRRLSDLADDVLEGRQDKAVAAVASQVLNVYLRAVSVEMKLKEQLELTERLTSLEEALGHNERGSRSWGA
jgi:predicted RNA-binding Zn ribbon-like protein